MDKRDFYEVLGVPRDASPKDVKTAYRKLAMQFHPDRNPDDPLAESKFKEAAEAYEVLSNPDKRTSYDRYGHEGLGASAGFGGRGFSSVDDILNQFGDIFGDFFGFGSPAGSTRTRGADVRVDVTLDFEEAVFGTTQTLAIKRHEKCQTCDGVGAADGSERVTCSTCQGRGQVHHAQGFFTLTSTCPVCRGAGSMVSNPCKDCHGEGIVEVVREVQVAIPAGVDEGTRLRLRGEGEAGRNEGSRGDLYVFLKVRPSPVFERDGADIHLRAPISFVHAAMGGTLEIPTLEGTEVVDVAPGTQNGDRTVLRGLGIPKVNRESRGNLFAHFVIEVPRELSDRQRELLVEFARESGQEVGAASVVPPDYRPRKPSAADEEADDAEDDESASANPKSPSPDDGPASPRRGTRASGPGEETLSPTSDAELAD